MSQWESRGKKCNWRGKGLNSFSAGATCYKPFKQFGLRLGPTKCWAWSGSRLFDTLDNIPERFFKFNFENNNNNKNSRHNYPACKELKFHLFLCTRVILPKNVVCLLGQIKKLFLGPSLICFKCPSSVFFQTWIKEKWPHLFHLCQNQTNILYLKWMKKGASLVFNEIKNKKVASSDFGK